jgi:hypothetical protein
LDGYAYGEGDTLQDAADDLIARLLTTAMCLRSGFTSSTEVRPPDLCWLDFVYRLGEIAAGGATSADAASARAARPPSPTRSRR